MNPFLAEIYRNPTALINWYAYHDWLEEKGIEDLSVIESIQIFQKNLGTTGYFSIWGSRRNKVIIFPDNHRIDIFLTGTIEIENPIENEQFVRYEKWLTTYSTTERIWSFEVGKSKLTFIKRSK